MEILSSEHFKKTLLERTPIIDVRAPIEFAEGHLPNSVNLPLLDDDQRCEIGTLYKQQGRETAIRRGYELISGAVKEARVRAWSDFVKANPQAVLTCFRGGMRSQISQQWLAEAGFVRPRLGGGYKAFRNFLIDEMNRLSEHPLVIVSGPTGAGKTLVTRQAARFRSVLDLEKLANHRGSAFGAFPEGQPSQIDFENELATCMIRAEGDGRSWVVEDESRMVGHRVVPEKLFLRMRESGVILISESLESRVEVIFDDYIGSLFPAQRAAAFERYAQALRLLERKLGGVRTKELLEDLTRAVDDGDDQAHRVWIEKILTWYYDPLYAKSFANRKPRVVFEGPRQLALEFLRKENRA